MVRQAIGRDMMQAFSDELQKIAVAPPSIRAALTRGSTFSANALKPTTIKHVVPPTGGTKAGKIIPPTGTQAKTPGILGANIRKPTTIDPKMPLVQGTPPASPVHVAPQVNPQAATIRQGAPQTVNSAAPTAGGAGVPSPTANAPAAGGPSAGSMSSGARR